MDGKRKRRLQERKANRRGVAELRRTATVRPANDDCAPAGPFVFADLSYLVGPNYKPREMIVISTEAF